MELDALLPFNGEVIRTEKLRSLGFNARMINKLILDNILERTRRGYYKVTIKYEIDTDLMAYYLMNDKLDEFYTYFTSLSIKDYEAYYYLFIYDVIKHDYDAAYQALSKCCELNKDKNNKETLYTYALLLTTMMGSSNKKLEDLRSKIFRDQNDGLKLFLDCVIQKDYDRAFQTLRAYRMTLPKLDVKILRDLSLGVAKAHPKKSKKEEDYDRTYEALYNAIMNNDYDAAYYYLSKLYHLKKELKIDDTRLSIIIDLFNCFNFIVEHQGIDLDTYKTNYKYHGPFTTNFYEAINRNDYLNAKRFAHAISEHTQDRDFAIYDNLLSRIYNFLNIRTVIKMNNPYRQISLDGLVKEHRYKEAMAMTSRSTMDDHDKNMVNSLLESLASLEDSSLFNTES